MEVLITLVVEEQEVFSTMEQKLQKLQMEELLLHLLDPIMLLLEMVVMVIQVLLMVL